MPGSSLGSSSAGSGTSGRPAQTRGSGDRLPDGAHARGSGGTGTGARLRALERPLAGKTGTTNDNRDAWFLGFSPDLAVGVYVGFDQPETLGDRETGSSVAVPVWQLFMAEALAGEPVIPFRIPPGVRLVRIDADHGLLPGEATNRIITEAFRPGSEPTVEADRHVVLSLGDDRSSGVY